MDSEGHGKEIYDRGLKEFAETKRSEITVEEAAYVDTLAKILVRDIVERKHREAEENEEAILEL